MKGGKREGAGRKPINPEDRRIQISLSVSTKTRDIIDELRKKGFNINREFEKYVLKVWFNKFEEDYRK